MEIVVNRCELAFLNDGKDQGFKSLPLILIYLLTKSCKVI